MTLPVPLSGCLRWERGKRQVDVAQQSEAHSATSTHTLRRPSMRRRGWVYRTYRTVHVGSYEGSYEGPSLAYLGIRSDPQPRPRWALVRSCACNSSFAWRLNTRARSLPLRPAIINVDKLYTPLPQFHRETPALFMPPLGRHQRVRGLPSAVLPCTATSSTNAGTPRHSHPRPPTLLPPCHPSSAVPPPRRWRLCL